MVKVEIQIRGPRNAALWKFRDGDYGAPHLIHEPEEEMGSNPNTSTIVLFGSMVIYSTGDVNGVCV